MPARAKGSGAGISPGWTKEQESAITARGGNLLVSAAAGAGKTAVLVERVIRLVLERKANVDELLVVTFTEAAASELRGRLAGALRGRLADLEAEAGGPAEEEVAWLHLQLALLGRASISTLHSFCLSVIRRYFHRLGLDPGLEVLAEEEATLLRNEVLDEVFEELYEAAEPEFHDLVEAYGSERGDEGLRRTVLRLHNFARSHPDPQAWLDSAVSRFEVPEGTPMAEDTFGRAALESIALALEATADRLGSAQTLTLLPGGPAAYGPVIADDALRAGAALEAARRAASGASADEGWEALTRSLTDAASFESLPRIGKDQGEPVLREVTRDLRDEAKKALRKLALTFAGRSWPELACETRSLAGRMRGLAALVTRFDAAYRRAKDERGALDFSDLEHYCLAALTPRADAGQETAGGACPESAPSEAAEEIRDRYAEVLVDEYQDVNEVQERILNLVSKGNNLFLVGDVKQSIYRFRLADPGLFSRKYATYVPLVPDRAVPGAKAGAAADAGASRLVVLPDNFRSRKNVLDAVNFVFRQVMRREAAEIEYDQAAELRYGAGPTYGPGGDAGPAVELHLLEGDVRGEAGSPGARDDVAAAPEAEAGEGEAGGGADDGSVDGVDQPSLEDLHVVERETGLIAGRIRTMLGGPRPLEVYDKATKAYRQVRYSDIAILMRATTGLANLVVETLSRAGIPAAAQLSTGYFTAPEVETIVALLRLIDNPRQDIPLAAVLRSPIVGLDEEELAQVRLRLRPGEFYEAVIAAASGGGLQAVSPGLSGRLRDFLERLEGWRERARRGPLGELIWGLYRETGFYAYSGGLPGGPARQANLRGLYDRARAFDQFTRQGLARFLRFIDHLRESGEDLGPPQPVGEGEDAVRVMSIHRSKGLEFPVVFLPHLGKAFNLSDTRGDLICHRDLGFGPSVTDAARRLKYPSLASRAVAERLKRESIAEEMRCLYVAMTRARDCLVLVGTKPGLPRALAGWCLPITSARIGGAGSFLDWLVPAAAAHPEARILREAGGYGVAPPSGASRAEPARRDSEPSRWWFGLYGAEGHPGIPRLETVDRPVAAAAGLPWPSIARLDPLPGIPAGQLTRALSWEYPAARLATLPAKVLPTELERLLGTGLEEDAGDLPGHGGQGVEGLHAVRPVFLESTPVGSSPAERGKATHLLLQHADLDGPLDQETLASLAASLADREMMTPEQAGATDVAAAARFFASDLGRSLVAARSRTRREVPFTLSLPLAEVYGLERTAGDTGMDETVLVQGIIDALVVEPDGLTIIDFKTDRVTAEETRERAESYRTQVSLYRRAVKTIWNRPVKAAWLYFLTPGVAVRA